MRGVFAEGINARSDAGLLKLCRRAGISAEEMHAALTDPGWRSIAEANREDMLAQGIWGVPAFRLNHGHTHWGQDRLWLLEEQLQAACASVIR
jgi:2-hydroxychromene-2-carboxylate isomerase